MLDKKSHFNMSFEARNEYLKVLVKKLGYFSKSKKEKSQLLDDYCKITGLNRNYVIRKINSGSYLKSTISNRGRKIKYDEEVVSNLIKIWKMLHYPCGKKLEKILRDESENLIIFKALNVSLKIQKKLKEISSSTIDMKLREVKRKMKYKYKTTSRSIKEKTPKKFKEENGGRKNSSPLNC